MDVREKLVELQSIITCPNAICNFCEHFKNKSACEKHKKEVIADNMIAHGVTVRERGYCYHWKYEAGDSPNSVDADDFCSYGERRNNEPEKPV